MKIDDYINNYLTNSSEVVSLINDQIKFKIKEAAEVMVETYYKKGGTVYLFGNGGSAAIAQHLAGELSGMFQVYERIPLATHALSTDTSIITAISNDLGFDKVFSRQIEALAQPKDLIIAMSTSGNSKNVIEAVKTAKKRHVKTIGLTGKAGGKLAEIVDIAIKIPSDKTYHIQEGHLIVGHMICGIVEQIFFGEKGLENV